MSMNLYCSYTEEFKSKIGVTLTYYDTLELQPTNTSETHNILWYTEDGEKYFKDVHGRDKTNQEIFDHYKKHLLGRPSLHISKPEYSYEDYIAISLTNKNAEDCTPVAYYTEYSRHIRECEKFFEKYNGIENVNFGQN